MTNGPNKFDDLLSAYYDGELTAAERQAVEQMVQESADARTELEDYQSISASLRSLPKERAPEGFQAAVLDRIQQGASAKHVVATQNRVATRRQRRTLLALVIGGMMTAACVVIAIQGRFASDSSTIGQVAQTEASSREFEIGAPTGEDPRAMTWSEAREEVPEASTELAESESIGGVAAGMAGFSTADAAVGDAYSYFEQTEEGDVVVVEATVIDVRQALDQLQVLFLNNSIPTATVALSDEASLVREPNSDLAIYVESDPLLINNALKQLREELELREEPQRADAESDGVVQTGNSFVGLKIAGTINSPTEALAPNTRTQIGRLQGRLNEALDQPSTDTESRSLSYGSEKNLKAQNAPSARFSISPETRSDNAAGASSNEAIPELRSPEPVEPLIANYQTIVNVSKSRLSKELQAPKEAVKDANDPVPLEFYRDLPREKAEYDFAPASGAAAQLSSSDKTPPMLKQVQRRGRMLVVLERRAEQTAGEESARPHPAAPVEAPFPPGR